MKQHLQTAFKHIRRSPYQAAAAVLVLLMTLFITSVFTHLFFGSEIVLRYFETRPQITAYLKDEVGGEQIDLLKAKLAETGKIKEAKYISKEEALAFYKEQNKSDPLLLEMVNANILPASLEIATTDIAYLTDIAEILKTEPIVEEVDFQEDVVAALKRWTTTIRVAGLALVGIFSLLSLLIILVITGMKITIRKEEIEIMRLLGASFWYIAAPFLLEGIFYGAVGAILGWFIPWILLLYLTPLISSYFAGIGLLPAPPLYWLSLLGAEILLGSLVGIIGSLVAVKRYLK